MSDADRLLRDALALHHAGRLREAQLLYSRVLAEDPENAEALHLSGLVAFREARFDDAIGLLRRAVARAPGNALYLGNLGNAQRDSGRREEAIESYERALAIDPDHVSLRFCLGAVRLETGATDAAIRDFRDVIAHKPDHFHAHLSLGNALRRIGDAEGAERAYRRAVALNPDSADALSELASVLTMRGRSDEALGLLKRRSVVDAESPQAHADLARALEHGGDLESALASFQQALATAPDALDIRCDFCALLQRTCDWERLALHARDVLQAIAHERAGIPARLLVSLHEVTSSMQLQAARANAATLAGRTRLSTRRIDANASRLRIGYLCADPGENDPSGLLAEVLERHDRARFEAVLFLYGSADHGPMRARLRAGAEQFFDVSNLDDERSARRIADASVDILTDLDGNTDKGRMGIAAFRPAPIQVSWLGVPATRGADWYDYILADRQVAPVGVESAFAEEIVRLPNCYRGLSGVRARPNAPATRAGHHLPEDGVVLCCFDEPSAITAPMFALWLRVLAVVPQATLWLRDGNALATSSLRRRAVQQGIAPERIVFAPSQPQAERLARYLVADLAIDTFACVSPSTAADALSMGCPFVTLTGETFAARVATSFLVNVGLPELAAVSPARYEELIIDLAGDAPRRDALRDRLQHAAHAMPLFDPARFVQDLERAFARMAAHAVAGGPRAFDLRGAPRREG